MVNKRLHLFFIKIGIFFLIIIGLPVRADKVFLNFDELFPSSLYKEILRNCIYVWADMRAIKKQIYTIYSDDLYLYLSTVIGRLAYTKICLEHLSNNSQHEITLPDCIYLKYIITHINQIIFELHGFISAKYLLCIQCTMQQFYLYIENIRIV